MSSRNEGRSTHKGPVVSSPTSRASLTFLSSVVNSLIRAKLSISQVFEIGRGHNDTDKLARTDSSISLLAKPLLVHIVALHITDHANLFLYHSECLTSSQASLFASFF
jgi:hypothetical protein